MRLKFLFLPGGAMIGCRKSAWVRSWSMLFHLKNCGRWLIN